MVNARQEEVWDESQMCTLQKQSGKGRKACDKEGLPEKIMSDQKPYEPITIYMKERESDL